MTYTAIRLSSKLEIRNVRHRVARACRLLANGFRDVAQPSEVGRRLDSDNSIVCTSRQSAIGAEHLSASAQRARLRNVLRRNAVRRRELLVG